MPQPTLFEATFISVRRVSQERPVGVMIPTLGADLQMIVLAS
ncbi:MAG TPA: hypothetical protein VK637_08255 [Chthoniobacterales bacterium]|jgi:hypothetical protein|nr:hypothetical protein [Chthoniobacterales bacterium]